MMFPNEFELGPLTYVIRVVTRVPGGKPSEILHGMIDFKKREILIAKDSQGRMWSTLFHELRHCLEEYGVDTTEDECNLFGMVFGQIFTTMSYQKVGD